MNRFIVAQSKDPYKNLALEAWLFENGRQDVWLYLWQNQHTVVIGRNQNAWKECRLSALEADGGKLARRGSGGGAVYHDVGNLNFTFILPRDVYDLRRQLGVILAAMERLGIPARFTGRNDLVTQDGAKFSGNAFQFSAHTALHHGTILVSADMGALSQYLAPSKAKLAAKGVDSVRSRVCNLNTLRPGLTVHQVAQAVAAAFAGEYGPYQIQDPQALDQTALAALEARFASWEWRLGRRAAFNAQLETRFPWGEVTFQLALRDGRVQEAHVFSDAMDADFIQALGPCLTGAPYQPQALAAAVSQLPGPLAQELAQWLQTQTL